MCAMPAITLDLLDHILPFYFHTSPPPSGKLEPPKRQPSTNLLLVSSAFRHAVLPHIFRTVVVRDLALFFDPEYGLFNQALDGERRWATVRELWIPNDMTPPLRAPPSSSSPQSPYLVPLSLPRLSSSSSPKPRVYIYDNSTSVGLGHTSFLIRARAFCPHPPRPSSSAPPILSIGTPDNERYLSVIRSATVDLALFLIGILRAANPLELHSFPESLAKLFLHRRQPLPTLSFANIETVRLYIPYTLSSEHLATETSRFRRLFLSSVLEFASDHLEPPVLLLEPELSKEFEEGTVRCCLWNGNSWGAARAQGGKLNQ